MKLSKLFEAEKNEAVEWVLDNCWRFKIDSDEWTDRPLPANSVKGNSDGSATIKSGIRFPDDLTEIPVKIKKVEGKVLGNGKLASFKNCPEEVTDYASYAGSMKKLDGITKVAKELSITNCKQIKSLKDIHKHVDHCEEMWISPYTESNILGLLKINGLKKVKSGTPTFYGHETDRSGYNKGTRDILDKALAIINKYLGQGLTGYVKAQRELMEADLDDYAEE